VPLPLEGILVLELSHIVAGPFCGAILADYGADLIKIEAPAVGDRGRTSPPFIPGTDPPVSASFWALGRSRRGLALDLKRSDGQRVFRELSARADVVLENFTPGTMDRLGLGYGALKQVNPRLVYAAISGFGQLKPFVGPYSNRPANNAIAQGMGGLMELTGEPDGRPGYVGATVGDTVPGLWAALGIVLALRQRDATGVGQFVDVAMYDALAAMCYPRGRSRRRGTSTTARISRRGKPSSRSRWTAAD
jgi:CoA:oxalate CoA-transferase